MDGLTFKNKRHVPALFPQKDGHYFTLNQEAQEYKKLLETQNPNETKMNQIVSFLEEQCAYKRETEKRACEKSKR